MRLIDADVMIEYLRKQLCDNCHEQKDWCDICDYAYLIDEMKKVPTVDAVEVVRCRDCKWWDEDDNDLYGYCMAMKHGYMSANWEIGIYRKYKGDFYCADGERREDET